MICRLSCLALVLLSGSGTLGAHGEPAGSLHGRVTVKGAGPLAGTEVIATLKETGLTRVARTDARGTFSFPALAAGTYGLSVRTSSRKGIEPVLVQVEAGKSAMANLALDLQEARASVAVTAILEIPAVAVADLAGRRASTSDTASLLQDLPGVSLAGAGGVSSLPGIHGLADDRLRVKVDGMDLIAACPNHMNPPLSYVDPSSVGSVKIHAGVTPVSVGGDSIGGSIILETLPPAFAGPGQGFLLQGEAGSFYRSNGAAKGANLTAAFATESLNVSYAGSTAQAGNSRAGGNFKTFTATGNPGVTLPLDGVGSSGFLARNQSLGAAWRGARDLLDIKLGWQDIPHEYFPNQRMDMLGNTGHRANLHYLGQRSWGALEARVYRETVDHYMNFSPDKQFWYGTPATIPGMPMNTDGLNTGGSLKANVELGKRGVLRIGGEYQHYRLNDGWSPSGGGMAPYTFLNINNGRRDRAALFGEWEDRFGDRWTAMFGLRYEQVDMNADPVHGYNLNLFPVVATPAGMMNQTRDAANFNNQDRNRTDHNLDWAGSARFTVDATSGYEVGFARKVRSPNLYERYSWSSAGMMAIMNNFVGDGNGYLGDPALKPEVAYTLSVTGNWHSSDQSSELRATPYITYVRDYIDAIQWNGATYQRAATRVTNQFAVLRYVNQDARIWGVDVSGHLALGGTAWGSWALKGLLGYTKGTNVDSGDGLYNIMPFNGKMTLSQALAGWSSALEGQWVGAKTRVSTERNELKTGGYTLFNLRFAYVWNRVRLDLAVENLFDKLYTSPLGGAYTGQGRSMGINSIPWGIGVPGPGRSINAAVTIKF